MGVKEEPWSEAGAPDDADAGLPFWADDHLPKFREILRTISFYQGFALLPVELPGSGVAPPMQLALKLAEWLGKKGLRVLRAVPEETGWESFTPDLLSMRPGARGVVMVVGSAETTQKMRSSLRLLNQRRDTLAKNLGCPLLWCGTSDFLNSTLKLAPDFWSIREIGVRFEASTHAKMQASRPTVRTVIAKVLRTDSDLDAFCGDYFPDVHARFTQGMDRVAKVNLLLDRVDPARILERLREAYPYAVQEAPARPPERGKPDGGGRPPVRPRARVKSTETLLISHHEGTSPPQFVVARAGGGEVRAGAMLSPVGFPVANRPNSDLLRELRWYLENFLDYPFPPATEHADQLQAALAQWGEQAFHVLFGAGAAAGWIVRAREEGYDKLTLRIRSDDPAVLSWPWEALRDPEAGVLAHLCRIERCLNKAGEPVKLSRKLPSDRVNILLVTARPLEGDIRYRSISRPLVELIDKLALPARAHVLRPPTFAHLREHLQEHPDHYHVVHFDGHGAFGPSASHPGPYKLGAPQGRLLFENDRGDPDEVSAETLSELLREHRIAAVVLNACQSGMIDPAMGDPMASVATALLRAGVRSVVAMAYSLYVSAARVMLPAFYRRLFSSGEIAEAVRAGRQAMRANKGRTCALGKYDLEDWVIPVLYASNREPLRFATGQGAPRSKRIELPEAARESENPYGFIGRDGPILALERAMRAPNPAIVIHGLAGIGKTTLARGFVEWLDATDGLGKGCLWVSFQGVRSLEYVLNRMGEPLFGPQFSAAPIREKIDVLAGALREQPFVVVWDNFEPVAGSDGVPPALPEGDRQALHDFLKKLKGGKTKIILTSRSDEDWLGVERRKVAVPGLDGEERWELCEAMAEQLGMKIDRKDPELKALMDLLAGHPLAMRVVLSRLEKARAGDLVAALRTNLAALGPGAGDAFAEQTLYATLKLAEEAVPEDLRELLVPLGMHEQYVDGDYLEAMAQQVDAGWARERIDRFLSVLSRAGLLRDLGQAIFEMHPALSGFLRTSVWQKTAEAQRDAWARSFVNELGSLANDFAPLPLHEQRYAFHRSGASFRYALGQAKRLGMALARAALTQALAFYALNTRSFEDAEKFSQELVEICKTAGNEAGVAGALHQLGNVAYGRRDFDAAKIWYKKSLAITRKIECEENEKIAAKSYAQLGKIAEARRDFGMAEALYKRSLDVSEKLGNVNDAANCYHHLGNVALERCDFDTATAWYKKSSASYEQLGHAHGTASSYHQLGMVALERRDFDAAEAWYKKSSTIHEQLGDAHGAASSYHQLGILAQDRRDLDAAETWYKKSLAIKEKLGDAHGAALSYHQLGTLAALQGRLEESARWLVKSIDAFADSNDPHNASKGVESFLITYSHAPPAEQPKLREIWRDAGLGDFPAGDSSATS